MSGRQVYLVERARELEDGEVLAKTIGIYSTRESAMEAVQPIKEKPGFRDHPSGFTVDPYLLDQNSWEDGFITTEEGDLPSWMGTVGK